MKIGLPGLLFLLLLALKLTHQIAWSWFWVTCPLWAGLAIALGFMAIMVGIVLIAAIADGRGGER